LSGWREVVVARLADVPEGGAVSFEVGEGDWPFRGLLVRGPAGLRAFANVCPHRGHPLDAAPGHFFAAPGGPLRCGSHGALFDPESGDCLAGPCAGRSLVRLNCRVAGDQVIVSAPDALAAVWPGPD